MRKSLFSLSTLALAGVALTSCSSDLDMPDAGNDGYVMITAKMPESMKTRAFSSGEMATTLHYAVYDAGTKDVIFTSETAGDPVAVYNNDLTFSLALNLVKGRTYDFVFWADCGEGSPYTFTPTDQDVTINYADLKSNEEKRDAFFNIEKNFTVSGNLQKNIQLYRPFGQLNIGTDDLDVAAKAGVELGTVAVTVTDVYNNLNLMTGVASATAGFDGSSLTYDFAAPPSGETFPKKADEGKKPYEYLAMNYVLTGNVLLDGDVNQAQKETKDVTIEIKDKNGRAVNKFDVSAVPFQRNYRTNIFGSLLTSSIDYTIEIVPDYNLPDYDLVTDYTMLKTALASDAAHIEIPAGATIAVPEGSEPLELAEGKTLTVNGVISGPQKSGKIFTVPAGGEATINGTGTIEFNYNGDRTQTDGSAHAIRGIEVFGKLNMSDVKMTAPNQKAGDCIYLRENAEAVLNNVTVNTGFRAITTLAGSTLTLNGGEYNSTSNNTVKDDAGVGVWAYCIVVTGEGSTGYFNGTKVTGIQGGVSVDVNCTGIFEDCDIATYHLPGTDWTAFYAIYSARGANAVVKSGKYYSPRIAVWLGDNDIDGATFGGATLQGGIYSSIGHDQQSNMDIPLAEGYQWVSNPDPATKDRYPYAIVKK